MTRWQYRIVSLRMCKQAERLTSALGALGSDGWELVAVYDKASNWLSGMEKGFALFKRPVPSGAEPTGAWADTASF